MCFWILTISNPCLVRRVFKLAKKCDLKSQISWELNFANRWDEKNSREQYFVNGDLEIFSILQILRKLAKSQHLVLVKFSILFCILFHIFLYSQRKGRVLIHSVFDFLLDQLHLISFKFYYFYMSYYQLYFKYFFCRETLARETFASLNICKIYELNHHELTNRKILWDKLLRIQ